MISNSKQGSFASFGAKSKESGDSGSKSPLRLVPDKEDTSEEKPEEPKKSDAPAIQES